MNALSLSRYRDAVQLDEPYAGPARSEAMSPSAVLDALRGERPEAERLAERLERAGETPEVVIQALLTTRPPLPLPPSLDEALAVLHARWAAGRPWVRVEDLHARVERPGGAELVLWRGDITTLRADAIVNAANSEMLGCFLPQHACIDNAIHRVAGPRLRLDCATIMGLQGQSEPTGACKATRGHHLPARFVLHTVGPVVRGALTDRHRADLASSYVSCLETAAQLSGVRSVAFCAISTGVFGYPSGPAAGLALEVVHAWLERHPGSLDRVIFDVFSAADEQTYTRALEDRSW